MSRTAKSSGHATAGVWEAEPRALIRAARDLVETDPRFAADVAAAALVRLLAGRGDETGPTDAVAAVKHLLTAARQLGAEAQAVATVETLIARAGPADSSWCRRYGRRSASSSTGLAADRIGRPRSICDASRQSRMRGRRPPESRAEDRDRLRLQLTRSRRERQHSVFDRSCLPTRRSCGG